jgi:hypothetical protein
VTVYLGPRVPGDVIGVATVALSAQGALRWRVDATAGGSVPAPGGVGSVVSVRAGTGEKLLGAPVTVKP